MDRKIPTAVFSSRAIKGGVEVVVIMGEEVHAWHTLAERQAFHANELDRIQGRDNWR
jgi:hypothetical protein